MPNVCLVGNHDLEDPSGRDAWSAVHGPASFHFADGGGRVIQAFAPRGSAAPLRFGG
jgi:hypothetical protein